MPIRAVVFDIGGVFFPWPTEEYFVEWGRRRGLGREGLIEALWHGPDIEAANLGGISAEEYARRCSARCDIEESELYALMEHCFAGELNRELAEYARALRSRHTVAALTNTWSFGRSLVERKLAGLFDLMVSSAEEGVRKPDERIYRVLLDRLGLAPEEVVFVDDLPENIEAARAVGIRGVRFVDIGQAAAELSGLLER